jgi:hypothetical protein
VAKKNDPITIIGLLLALWLITGGNVGGCNLPSVIAPSKVDRVTYVRAPKAPVPSGVSAAIAELNAQGVLATECPEDVTDGDGDVPEQYKVALPAARTSGIPSLVVQAGDKVLRTLKAPATKEQVLEAAK